MEQNNFQFLDLENKINPRTQLNQSSYKKYSKILNNLLGINNRGDYAVFTKLNSLNIDLLKIIKPEKIETIFNKDKFKIKIEKAYLSNSQKTKQDIDLDSLEATYLTKWKRYIKQVNETYQQTSIWPLFIGTYFLKGRLGDKTIYAPLVLKEVEIIIEDNEVFLIERNASVSLNEKLIFLIEEFQGTIIPNIKNDVDKACLYDVIRELNLYLKNSINFEFVSNEEKFTELRMQDIKNEKIVRTSGIVLLFAQPTGGVLRNAVIDLIKENKMDKIIKVNANEVLTSSDESIKNIVYKPCKIARICPTDPSQENAIISALNRNTIIIGPPGTGKSQTISNILANILLNNKKALFISQKRVALEVVLERMKSLQYFTLQLVDTKSRSSANEKQEFYKYMSNFLDLMRKASDSYRSISDELKPLVSYEQLMYWISKNNQNIEQEDVDLFSELKREKVIIDDNFGKILKNEFSSFKKISKFDDIPNIISLNERKIKSFAEKLNVEPKFNFLGIKIFDKSFTKLFKEYINLKNIMKKYNINNEMILKLKDYQNLYKLNEINKSYKLHQNELPKTNKFVSEERKIVEICAARARKIFPDIKTKDPQWFKKFSGRISREFTAPPKFISLFKNELKQLFNIYVSTPEALSSFIDFKKDKFDYVIFDEASQIFLEKAIPYMSIADKVIIAGDDQQMQPSNWFGHRSDVDDDEKEEENIDSLLTYAIENGIQQEMLELNYRSSAATLTTFSSKEFYKNNLKTLDNNKPIHKPIEIINVRGKWENKQNKIEAQKVIEILKENINKYKRIILLTLNKQQMELINIMLSVYEPEIYNKVIDGEIILKNLENIQGDEADLVIVSIAYTKDTALGATYVGRPGGRNALNVAITRARDKMIVIKSIRSDEIQTKGEMNESLRTFKNWIEFLELNEEDQKTYSLVDDKENINSIESSFEYDVIEWLKTKTFNKEMKLAYQYPIGSYRIDVTLLDLNTDKFILGIEVDGFLYHSTIRQRYNDLVRQNFIEAKGYPILRISELLWKTDKEKVYSLIKKHIENI